MLAAMMAYAIFAGILIVIVAAIFIAAGVSAIIRWRRQRREGTKADRRSHESGEG